MSENIIKEMTIGVVGAGMISDIYIENMMQKFSGLRVKSITSRGMEHARKKAEKYGLAAVSFKDMLLDPEIDMVVVLTPVETHEELIRAALLAGKHVYTEKTLTADTGSAAELLRLAKEKNLYLGSAPDTFLGAAWQTARKALDDGLIGEVTSFVLAANRDNNVLQTFFPFLRVPGTGICLDYGVYYLTALVSLLGPVARTAAIVRTPFPTHININPDSPDYGKEMDTPNESEVSAVLQLSTGVAGTLCLNADSVGRDQAFFAVYGTEGILYLSDPNGFGGEVSIIRRSDPEARREPLAPANPYSENSRGIGPAEMAEAIRKSRKNRASGEIAYHVLEILEAILQSGKTGQFVEITSTCERPAAYR